MASWKSIAVARAGQNASSFSLPAIAATIALVVMANPAKAANEATTLSISANEAAAFRDQVTKCWKMPPLKDTNISAYFLLKLNRDGTLAQRPIITASQLNKAHKAEFDTFATSAVKALIECQPYTMFKPEKYDLWKELEPRFFPNMPISGANVPSTGSPSTAAASTTASAQEAQKFDADKIAAQLDKRISQRQTAESNSKLTDNKATSALTEGKAEGEKLPPNIRPKTERENAEENLVRVYRGYILLRECAERTSLYFPMDKLKEYMRLIESDAQNQQLNTETLWVLADKEAQASVDMMYIKIPASPYKNFGMFSIADLCKGAENSIVHAVDKIKQRAGVPSKKDF